MKPAGHRILIKPDPVEETTDAGIILYASEQQRKLEKAGHACGTIVDIGMNAWKAFDEGEPWAKVGDRVIYAKYAGQFVTHPDTPVDEEAEEFVCIADEDILVIL